MPDSVSLGDADLAIDFNMDFDEVLQAALSNAKFFDVDYCRNSASDVTSEA